MGTRPAPRRERPLLEAPQYVALPQSVADSIRNAFFAGAIKPGDRLVEGDVARQLGVSRAPVREAMRALVREGLLVHVPRRGTFVVSFSPNDVREICVLRIALGVMALELVVARAAEPDLDRLQGQVDLVGSSGRLSDFTTRQRAVLDFHEELFRIAGNSRLYQAWQGVRAQVFAVLYLLGSHRRDTRLVVRDHQAIVDALRARDLPTAQRIMREIITTSGERLARRLEAEGTHADDGHADAGDGGAVQHGLPRRVRRAGEL